MAQIQVSDLLTDTLEVFTRRARAAAVPLESYVRQELIGLTRRRTAVDTIVEFLESQGRDLSPEFDSTAVELIRVYDLPADALGMLGRRARAAKIPLGAYVRQELRALARRGGHADALLELVELRERDPELSIDMAAVAAAVGYVRGE